ncbi:hypothetical protein NDU88_005503 [Pleurodeles waltl]|uniref:Uncharacterized protein n=1 Tax=Pleurodeles waltl TaxID=8319 RepID=A0AAV7PJR8_PLEWA|nr:hypothetical protein NDU88_005503 [Pleurodeles waltl]
MAARRPHNRAPRVDWPRPLWFLVSKPLDPKEVWSSLSLVIRRKATPLSCTPCTPRDGGDRRRECTQSHRALAGFEEAKEPPSGHLRQSCHLDTPKECMECNQMTRVVGATRWLGHKGIKAPQASGARGQRPGWGSRLWTCQSHAGDPELKPEGEASSGLVDSWAWAPWDTADWRKGTPAPGPSGGPAGAPEPEQAEEVSLGPVDSQAWAPQGMAGWRKGVPILGPSWGSLNTDMQGRPPGIPLHVPCHMAGQKTKPRQEVPTLGLAAALAGGPEPQ